MLAFAYNPASQIVGRTVTNDAFAAPPAYNVSRGYETNGLNQYRRTLTGGTLSATFDYDPNGNLTSDGMALREWGGRDWSGRQIRWHPRGGRHGDEPHWRVNTNHTKSPETPSGGQW